MKTNLYCVTVIVMLKLRDADVNVTKVNTNHRAWVTCVKEDTATDSTVKRLRDISSPLIDSLVINEIR